MRASDLIGQTATDSSGRALGRVADLICRPDPDGRPRVHSVLIVPRRRGRLFGYEREGIQGPWLIEQFARWLHRGAREIPWSEVQVRPE